MSRSPASNSLRVVARAAAVVLAALVLPGEVVAQARDRDARIPQAGSLWIEFAPEFYSWNEQFAENSDVAEDGQREPIYAHYDGSMTTRLFPGLDPMLAVVNQDAAALGFTPVTPQQLNLGALDFASIEVFDRRIPLGLQFGIGGFAAIEVSAPLVKTEVEIGFSFDSATAEIVRGSSVLADPSTFFSQFDAAQADLQAVLDGGTLSPADSATVLQLLADSEAFESALGARVASGQYLFTAGSAAGQEITGTYGGFETGFQSFGVSLPGFSLPASAVRADLDSYFQYDPVVGQPLQNVTQGWAIPEIEFGVRFKLLDTFGWPEPPPPSAPPEEPVELEPVTAGGPAEADSSATPSDTTAAPPEMMAAPADTAAINTPEPDPTAARPVGGAEPDSSVTPPSPGVRWRTTVGARYRLPLGSPDEDPYINPDVFLQQPVGTGTADIEVELYQDIGIGRRFLAVLGATLGFQMADDLVRRVSAPGAPYAYAAQKTDVTRDLGDFLQIVVSPRFSITEALSLAAEYTYWDKKADTYTSQGSVNPAPLELETSQTRHMLGIGAYYRTTRLFAAGRAGLPVDVAFLWQTAIAGQGGQTPAWGVVSASLRVPVQLFGQ